ncbi:hypothetical protein JX265_007054 [Neoarthrinium moseri]|uniref:Major facilitator superfamily (MFS) profile domain-containing protein n=1 Tax=Neoarthrinium moseri TaxID=1658444 RepID=A0A9P9WKM4_9PEZI|nr:hypothetical protein JX265_007054 [Neoarthrinium moseri]
MANTEFAPQAKGDNAHLHLGTLRADFKTVDGIPNIENRAGKESALLRKIDLRMMPLMMIIYVLNYLDRNNIAMARLGNFERDIGLVGTQYNTIISVFFVGYILTQIPTNMILNRMRPSIFLPGVMCAWAVVSAATGAVKNYAGMVALRFILGFVEAPFFPGALFLFSAWYTKKELAARISILYAAGQMAGAFGGLLGSAIMGGMDGKAGLADWRWLFIIEGCATIPVALVTMWIIPDYPATTKWLSEEERQIAVLRIAEEANEEDDRAEIPALLGLKMALTDPALYMIWFMQLGLNTSAAFINFFPTIVATLGYPQRETLLLSAPPYVFAAILGICNSWHSDQVRERWVHVVWPQVFCSIGFVISAVTLNTVARYIATFMMMSVYGSFGCILSWVSTTLPRPSTKRAISYAVVNAGSNFAAIYASYFYPSSQGPRYWQANVANVAFSAIALTTVFTPKSDCTAASAYASTTWAGNQWAYQLDSGISKATCYPSSYSAYQYKSGLWYSPGVCPLSYNYVATSIIRPTSGPATTLAICCPPGVHNAPLTGWSCYQVLTSSVSDLSFSNDLKTTLAGTTAFANPISVAWQQSDLSLFSPASAPILALRSQGITFPPDSTTTSSSLSATGTTSVTSSSPSSTDTAAPIPSSGSGISTASAAGIGVGATVGVFAIVGVIWWFRRHYRIAKRSDHSDQQQSQSTSLEPAKDAAHDTNLAQYHASLYQGHLALAEAPATDVPLEADYSNTRAELYGGWQGYEAPARIQSPT